MDLTNLFFFAAALFVAAASPGPGIIALVARVLARGARECAAFSLGIVAGDLVWLTVAIAGLAAIAKLFAGVFLAIKFAGAAYLIYLAVKMWRAEPAAMELPEAERFGGSFRRLIGGLTLTLGNPKPMVFYLALLPNIIPLEQITWWDFAVLALVTAIVLASVLSGYALLASKARRFFVKPKSVRRLNRGASLIMGGAAAAIIAR